MRHTKVQGIPRGIHAGNNTTCHVYAYLHVGPRKCPHLSRVVRVTARIDAWSLRVIITALITSASLALAAARPVLQRDATCCHARCRGFSAAGRLQQYQAGDLLLLDRRVHVMFVEACSSSIMMAEGDDPPGDDAAESSVRPSSAWSSKRCKYPCRSAIALAAFQSMKWVQANRTPALCSWRLRSAVPPSSCRGSLAAKCDSPSTSRATMGASLSDDWTGKMRMSTDLFSGSPGIKLST